jgi:hypothetical protein
MHSQHRYIYTNHKLSRNIRHGQHGPRNVFVISTVKLGIGYIGYAHVDRKTPSTAIVAIVIEGEPDIPKNAGSIS